MSQVQKNSRIIESITVLQRKHYGCLAKFFCCKCIHCCQDFDFSLLTSSHRKSVFQKMVNKYVRTLKESSKLNVIMDPFFILVALLLGEESQTYAELMAIIHNQNQPTIFSKEDLEFYIPELCTYLVFHQQLQNIELEKLMVRACKVDIHFSLKYYFYMKSLQTLSVGSQELRKYQRVSKYNMQFKNMINKYYETHKIQREFTNIVQSSHHETSIAYNTQNQQKQNVPESFQGLAKSQIVLSSKKQEPQSIQMSQIMPNLDTSCNPKRMALSQKKQLNKIRFLQQPNIYQPFICRSQNTSHGLFESTVNFFSDLVELSKLLVSSSNRKQELSQYLCGVNKRLPATIYVPFTKQSYQDLNIISVVVEESRVFSTKERAPYYVCFESFYNPTYNQGVSKDKKIRSKAHFGKQKVKKYALFEEDSAIDQSQFFESQLSIRNKEEDLRASHLSNHSKDSKKSKDSDGKDEKKTKKRSWNSFFNLKKIKRKIMKQKQQQNEQEENEPQSSIQSQSHQSKHIQYLVQQNPQENALSEVFGQTEVQQMEKISKTSPYSTLPGYKLIHVIIKSLDDLRQESFAMQLLQEIDKIFKMQKLPVKLLPYEVLPLSHEAGIMECVRDSITIDQLKRKGYSLQQILSSSERKKNFIYTLAGYSLVTYLLQVKDRHNGNIMIRKDGCLFHIDYGFFMSNAPGKGVELQKKLPFKLTNQYVEALDGIQSRSFQKFRRLFYQAFNACRKHQHRILILAKLMYSSYGKTMSCFQKGDQALLSLQQRFNPQGVSNDAQVSYFCQNLINSSIDNWRSRWYDKWQYYMQGILY